MEIIAYEMKYTKADIEKSNISSIPFEQRYFEEYMIRRGAGLEAASGRSARQDPQAAGS